MILEGGLYTLTQPMRPRAGQPYKPGLDSSACISDSPAKILVRGLSRITPAGREKIDE